MSSKKQRKTELYALPVTKEGVEFCENTRFSRITPTYILVYSDGKQPPNSVKIGEEDVGLLTVGDRQWLLDCGAVLLSEEIDKKTPEILKELSDKVNALEKALSSAKNTEEREIE